jgi:hypothetical protein
VTLDFPHVEDQRAAEGAHALNQALLGVRLAREEVGRARAAAPPLPAEAAGAWQRAVEARLADLAQAAEVLEHGRNVLAKVGRDVPRLREAYAAAEGEAADAIVREVVGLLSLAAEQFLSLSGPVAYPAVPGSAQRALGPDGSVVPLDDAHALPGGLVLVRGRDY